MAARKRSRPRLTKNVIAGLRVVESLAWADLESAETDDADQYEHGQDACRYLRQLVAWYDQQHKK
jgi:hypothetical protein